MLHLPLPESILLLGGVDGDNVHGAMLTSVEQVSPGHLLGMCAGWTKNFNKLYVFLFTFNYL